MTKPLALLGLAVLVHLPPFLLAEETKSNTEPVFKKGQVLSINAVKSAKLEPPGRYVVKEN
jgi:hypothetical protein